MSRGKPVGEIVAWPDPGEAWHQGDTFAVRGHVDRDALLEAIIEQAPEIAQDGLRLSDDVQHTLARAIPDNGLTRVWFFCQPGRGTFAATVGWLVKP